MKKVILFILGLVVTPFTSAQILNADFEDWSNGAPVYWFTSNNPFCSPGAVNIFQTSKASNGNSAVYGKVISANVIDECGGGNGDFSPSIASYDWEGDFVGFASTGRPKQLRVHYIYKPVGEGGAFTSSVYLTKWDALTGDRIVIGTGGFFIFNTDFLDSNYTEHVSPINYYYDEEPDSIILSFGLFSNELGSEFYLDDISLSFMHIISPSNDEIIIAGEKDTIRWDAGSENIDIMYSLDDGNSYTTLESNYPADSGKYIWDVPDDFLSAKAKIRIEDSDDNTQYDEKSVYIKPYIITKLDANGDYIAYDINSDRWGFSNTQADMWPNTWFNQFDYQGTDPFSELQYSQWQADSTFSRARSSRHSDWVSWVNTFGTDDFYRSVFLGIYAPSAVLKWRSKWGQWGGSCFGIAAANALAFTYTSQFYSKYPGFPSGNPISVVSDSSVKSAINELYTHQYGRPSITNDNINGGKTPNQTLDDLKALFKTNRTQTKTLTIFNNGGSGGHTILAYELKKDQNQDNIYYVNVYDNSNPNSNNPITIDRNGNGGSGTWSTPDWTGWGGTTGMYLEIVSGLYRINASLPKRQGRQSALVLPNNILEINSTSSANIEIQDLGGNKTGFSNNQLLKNIPNARSLITKNGSEDPPYGYLLPIDNYSIQINNFLDTSLETFFFTGNKTFLYQRDEVEQTENDRLFFDGGVSASNPDSKTKSVKLLNLINETTQEKLTIIRSIELAQNDSIKIENPDSNKVRLISYGSTKKYDIELNSVAENEIGRFGTSNIDLISNTTHTFIPNWDNLTNDELTILVDIGNDGTIDDTLKIKNQITGIEDDQGSLISPVNYNLAQNYPNPFNPITAIQYSIPVRSNVVLRVYDVLGNEVVTLVNEDKPAGDYQVDFNASELSSGVYFYKLQAGNFVETKKMILLK